MEANLLRMLHMSQLMVGFSWHLFCCYEQDMYSFSCARSRYSHLKHVLVCLLLIICGDWEFWGRLEDILQNLTISHMYEGLVQVTDFSHA